MTPRRPRPRPEPRPAPASARSGAAGEALAAAFLRAHGFVVLARDLRTTHGELDLLVRRRRTYAAVEVKARADHPAPERLVDDERLDRMQRALQALAPDLRPRPRALRLDVIAVRWRAEAPAELSHFPSVRQVALPWSGPPAAKGVWRRPEAAGYAWSMAARLWVRCAASTHRLWCWFVAHGRRPPARRS